MTEKSFVLVSALIWGLCIITSSKTPETSHAFCRIAWLVGVPCDQVNMAIVTVIKSKLSYRLGLVTPNRILANHTSKFWQIENLNFHLMPTSMNAGCHIESSSESPYLFTLFDNGTNYCNLHKIMKGSGLMKSPGFTVFTNEWLCFCYGASLC